MAGKLYKRKSGTKLSGTKKLSTVIHSSNPSSQSVGIFIWTNKCTTANFTTSEKTPLRFTWVFFEWSQMNKPVTNLVRKELHLVSSCFVKEGHTLNKVLCAGLRRLSMCVKMRAGKMWVWFCYPVPPSLLLNFWTCRDVWCLLENKNHEKDC